MKYTLLEIVRRVLSSMDVDSVNTLSETNESLAIARVAEEVYYELISRSDWPHLEGTSALYGSNDSELPNILKVPENIKYIKKFWYNNKELKYVEPEQFYDMVNNRSTDPDNIELIATPPGAVIKVINNRDPEFFTLIGIDTIVTDSYDKEKSTTLLGDNTLVTGSLSPTFIFSEEFIPDLPEGVFPTYLAMVKRAAFIYFRREPSMNDERSAVLGLGRILRDKHLLFRKENKINYGRKK